MIQLICLVGIKEKESCDAESKRAEAKRRRMQQDNDQLHLLAFGDKAKQLAILPFGFVNILAWSGA